MLLARCDVLYVLCLPRWKESVGVKAESAFALERGMEVQYLDEGLICGNFFDDFVPKQIGKMIFEAVCAEFFAAPSFARLGIGKHPIFDAFVKLKFHRMPDALACLAGGVCLKNIAIADKLVFHSVILISRSRNCSDIVCQRFSGNLWISKGAFAPPLSLLI